MARLPHPRRQSVRAKRAEHERAKWNAAAVKTLGLEDFNLDEELELAAEEAREEFALTDRLTPDQREEFNYPPNERKKAQQ